MSNITHKDAEFNKWYKEHYLDSPFNDMPHDKRIMISWFVWSEAWEAIQNLLKK